eukprot:2719606-Pyramimonas_sp.AAC.1
MEAATTNHVRADAQAARKRWRDFVDDKLAAGGRVAHAVSKPPPGELPSATSDAVPEFPPTPL